MLKDLIKIANKLDSLGLTKEADFLDNIIKKIALEENILEYKVAPGGEKFSKIIEEHKEGSEKTLAEQAALNNISDSESIVSEGTIIKIYNGVPKEFNKPKV